MDYSIYTKGTEMVASSYTLENLISLSLIVGIIVFLDFVLFKIAKKMDYKGPFWKFLIPFYSNFIFVKSTGLNPWFFLLLYVPIMGILFLMYLWYVVSLRLGRNEFGALFWSAAIMLMFGIPLVWLAFEKQEFNA